MYIDKIYTKLYSNKDWNGLEQLVSEIKTFSRRAYEGLTQAEKSKLKAERNELARRIKLDRSVYKKTDDLNDKLLNKLSREAQDQRVNAIQDHNRGIQMSKANIYDSTHVPSFWDNLLGNHRYGEKRRRAVSGMTINDPEYIDPYRDEELKNRGGGAYRADKALWMNQ